MDVPHKNRHHFEEAHQQKALHEALADKLSGKITDLIHTKVEQEHLVDIADNRTAMLEKIADTDYNLHEALEHTENSMDVSNEHYH